MNKLHGFALTQKKGSFFFPFYTRYFEEYHRGTRKICLKNHSKNDYFHIENRGELLLEGGDFNLVITSPENKTKIFEKHHKKFREVECVDIEKIWDVKEFYYRTFYFEGKFQIANNLFMVKG